MNNAKLTNKSFLGKFAVRSWQLAARTEPTRALGLLASVLLSTVLLSAAGCGSSVQQPPPQAVMHGPGKPPPSQAGNVWTKADKIAAVNKAPISEDQKKAEIAKLNSEP